MFCDFWSIFIPICVHLCAFSFYLCSTVYCCHWKVVDFPSIKKNIWVIFHVIMGSDLFWFLYKVILFSGVITFWCLQSILCECKKMNFACAGMRKSVFKLWHTHKNLICSFLRLALLTQNTLHSTSFMFWFQYACGKLMIIDNIYI